jgi:hypothetical protein
MPQQLIGKAPLSVHRAFVVHFRTSSNIACGPIEGRVEHVVSGQSTHFDSLEKLLAFMARVLASVRAPPRRRPSSGS